MIAYQFPFLLFCIACLGVWIVYRVSVLNDFPLEESYFMTQHAHLDFQKTDSDIALCLMVKDDTDVVEWVTYHNRLGVNR